MIGKGNRSQDSAPSQRSARSLRRRAEEIVRENAATSPEKLDSLSPEEIRKTLQELYVHQIELQMQNEELRRTQAELDSARARYFDLYDLAPVGYCTICENGLIQETNLTAACLLDKREARLSSSPFPGSSTRKIRRSTIGTSNRFLRQALRRCASYG